MSQKIEQLQNSTQLPGSVADWLSSIPNGSCLALVTGVFDILHEEHLQFLSKTKSQSDVVLVAVESDVRVRQIKGEGRPVNSQQERAARLLQLPEVDFCCILPDEFGKPEHHRAFISLIRPTFLAVSSHTQHLDKKQAILKEFGGEVRIVHQHNPQISTTLLLKNGYSNTPSE